MTKLIPHNYYQTVAIIPAHILHPQIQVWIQTRDFSLPLYTRILFLGTVAQLGIHSGTDSTHPLFEIIWDRHRSSLSKIIAIFSRFSPYNDISPKNLIFEILHQDVELPISPGDLIAISPDYLPDLAPLPSEASA